MTRREMTRLLAGAGLGAVAGSLGFLGTAEARPALFLLTDRPEDDLRLLLARGAAAGLHAEVAVVPPAPQDLTILRGGRIEDPLRADVPAALAETAQELRARRRPGHALLSLEPRRAPAPDAVTFELAGTVYDRLSLAANYRRIEVPGALGPTVFRLEDGRLSVVSSSCRHELCKRMGPRTTGRIICAPNRLTATLPPAPSGLDAVTG